MGPTKERDLAWNLLKIVKKQEIFCSLDVKPLTRNGLIVEKVYSSQ